MAKKKTTTGPKQVETLTHDEASRKNIPTAEFRSVMEKGSQDPLRVAYERRNRDLDPQLVWREKDERDWSDLVVPAPPLFIQEKVHPKVLIDDLVRQSARSKGHGSGFQPDLFAAFNGVPEGDAKTEFYQHDANWTNRMILGDSLQVMASLAEREGLRGQVQCIYLDPPYGIKFNSNFQWSTTSRDVKDGNTDHITREPEQVKAFRDTWRDGIHSYLTYLRDRLTVARDLLSESGSIFVQIGDENVHRVRTVMDEVFGDGNGIAQIAFKTTSSFTSNTLSRSVDHLLWYGKNAESVKYRALYQRKELADDKGARFTRVQETDGRRRFMTKAERGGESSIQLPLRIYRHDNAFSQGRAAERQAFVFQGKTFDPWPKDSHWKCQFPLGVERLARADRLALPTANSISYVRFLDDFSVQEMANIWLDTQTGAFTDNKLYVVQTNAKVIERCLLMTTDPGDLVLDPTCGSGTTAYVAEQWGRRWITVDTSRVALALARARIMGARYLFYHLADSRDGQLKEAEIRRIAPSEAPTRRDLRQGFVYERVPHVTLKSIANNAEIDVLWEKHQAILESMRQDLNTALGKDWEEWQIPREGDSRWPAAAKDLHARWWEGRIARQRDIDASIARNADEEYLYDKPYEDKKTVRVAGPFTVESLSPHRVMSVDENDELIDPLVSVAGEKPDFVTMVLENLKTAGVQQAHKVDKIGFSSAAVH
jgi:adenine-specific DNA-methyltransferase